ncbi:hypothetical protein [Actinoplanes sp. NPDC049802]|uniref:hypothetical protein n=1 Tax=Actinoplanes sp. NPDC049802 TaxID=3154742 RepID=UPI0033F4773B
MHLIPPMDDEPPPEYVAFVTLHAAELRAEAYRLVGGAPVFEEIYLAVLTDLAGHWRRLRWLRRTDDYVHKRLRARTAQWREDQVYEVEVRVLRPPEPVVPRRGSGASLALLKAAVIEGTARASLDSLADAEIAWVHAWLASRLRRTLGYAIGSVLLVLGMIQYMAWLSTGPT